MRNLLITVALLSALTACTSMDQLGFSEDKFQHSWIDKNTVNGKTTMEDIRRIYGEPYRKTGDGLNDNWKYRSTKRAAGVAMVDKAQETVMRALPWGAKETANKAEQIGGPAVKDNKQQELTFFFRNGILRYYN